jgi:L-seryl-tRNA(Ser) seleniumtransferase
MPSMTTPRDQLRALPAVEILLRHPALDSLRNSFSHMALVRLVRRALAEARADVLEGRLAGPPDEAELAARVVAEAAVLLAAGPVPMINATGVILHTNLGRAPLSAAALEAVAVAARGYSNLEYDLARGARGSRQAHVDRLLAFLAGAEAALAVNNNAAAVLLALNSLAEGREVLVSRGELVEIGGSFRIPDIMKKSGARLVEVGTTNKTHRKDFEKAIGPDTALLLKVHASNYRIEGFTAEVALAEMAEIGAAHGLPVMVDVGSGALLDVSTRGVEKEPLVSECLAAGADLVTFSGDKLLGGPQAGLVVGRADLVKQLKDNPLARCVRLDKLSLAALNATLRSFLDPDNAWRDIPVLAMLARPEAELTAAAEALAGALRAAVPGRLHAEVLAARAAVGGGALPLAGLATRAVAVTVDGTSPDRLERRLRAGTPPVLVRIQNDRVLFDLRTISPSELAVLPDLVVRALGS